MNVLAAAAIVTDGLTPEKRPMLLALLTPGRAHREYIEQARAELDSLIADAYQAGQRAAGMRALRAVDDVLKAIGGEG